MDSFDPVYLIVFLAGGGFGFALIWAFYRSAAKDAREARREVESLRERREELMRNEARHLARERELETLLQEEVKGSETRQKFLEDAQKVLSNTFKALSAEALESNQESFLRLAKTNLERYQEAAKGDLEKRQQAIGEIIKPVRESLSRVDDKIHQLEKQREGAYKELRQQVAQMVDTQRGLQLETGRLVKALRRPTGRGQWGELQLRRVVEMAGMQEHCDFFSQVTAQDDEGRRLRPDMVVKLPGGKQIVVDAKSPMDAYLDAVEARERGDENEEVEAMKRHAQQVRSHILQLGSRGYQDQFDTTPEFVVLFLPSESFFSDALAQDPGLIEGGVKENVILATPTTLIALLRSVAYGWRQESLAENAKEISDLGKLLHERISVLASHFARLGRNLSGSVESYNKVLGALETRVLVTARKFKELDAAPAAKEIESPAPVDVLTREVQAPELLDSGEEQKAVEGEEEEVMPEDAADDESVAERNESGDIEEWNFQPELLAAPAEEKEG